MLQDRLIQTDLFFVIFFPAAHSCLHTQFRCGDNVCIPKWQVCDGIPQCHDKSDELTCAVIANGCNATQFKCANRKCIANAFVCDSKDDCGDASDEKYCGKCCMTKRFRDSVALCRVNEKRSCPYNRSFRLNALGHVILNYFVQVQNFLSTEGNPKIIVY